MGTADAKRTEKSEKRARRAESVHRTGLDSLFAAGPGSIGADWGNASPLWIQAVIATMQRLGGAVTFGLSRDGNAYMLTLLLEGERKTLWAEPTTDLDTWLESVVALLDALST